MAAYRRVYDLHHLQADCQEPGSAPDPYVRQYSVTISDDALAPRRLPLPVGTCLCLCIPLCCP